MSGEAELRRRRTKLGTEEEKVDDKVASLKEKEDNDTTKTGEEAVVLEGGSYWLTRILYIRFLAFIYLVAFLVSYSQNKALLGDRGLTPVRLYLARLRSGLPSWNSRLTAAPTLLWLADHAAPLDPLLDGLSIAGAGLAAVLIITGAANMLSLAALWMLYHSLVSVGQVWFGFGWESQLLETGFLAIWAVPLLQWSRLPASLPAPGLAVWGHRWLLTRIMLGAGLIKLRGDSCWRDLTCMNYFYQTQPNPNPLSYYAHQAPPAWHSFETFGNHLIELIFPLFTFLPWRSTWIFNGCFQIFFQTVLISTGNLSFLNWLTMVPAVWYLDDKFLSPIFPRSTVARVAALQAGLGRGSSKVGGVTGPGRGRQGVTWVVTALLAWLSLPIIANLASPTQAMNRSFDPLRLVNTYGAFGSVTRERDEVVLEGSRAGNPREPNIVWLEYEFPCKPGNISRRPCTLSPFHYRLDWQMWFAGFQSYHQNPWLLHLMGKMLHGDPMLDSLLDHNPFRGQAPPRLVRARHYRYQFTAAAGAAAGRGGWWERRLLGEYTPVLDREILKPVYKQFGWTSHPK